MTLEAGEGGKTVGDQSVEASIHARRSVGPAIESPIESRDE